MTSTAAWNDLTAKAQFEKLEARVEAIEEGGEGAVGDVVVLEDVGGSPGLPAVDGSQLTDLTPAQVTGLGTAAEADTGTGIGDVVVLEDVGGSPGLPAVDGSQLTDLTPAQVTGLGTAAEADTGTGIGDVVVLEDVGGSPGLPAVNGSQLTGLGGVVERTVTTGSIVATGDQDVVVPLPAGSTGAVILAATVTRTAGDAASSDVTVEAFRDDARATTGLLLFDSASSGYVTAGATPIHGPALSMAGGVTLYVPLSITNVDGTAAIPLKVTNADAANAGTFQLDFKLQPF